MFSSCLLCVLLLAIVTIVANGEQTANAVKPTDAVELENKLTQDLIDWVRSDVDGFVNEKIVIKKDDENDPTSTSFGMYVTEDIEANDTLFIIPSKFLVTAGIPKIGDRVSGDYQQTGNWSGGVVNKINDDGTYVIKYDKVNETITNQSIEYLEKETGGGFVCETILNLVREMKLGNASKLAPYVNYLSTKSKGMIPSLWSKAGKDLLYDLLYDTQIPPKFGFSWKWPGECKNESNPEVNGKDLEELAAMLWLQRGWDATMIPLFDMSQHRNGRWLNAESDETKGHKSIEVRASRNIKKGEHIYYTYNLCSGCGGRVDSYGTPEILRDYGFVEQYPQRWFFHGKNKQNSIAFELDEVFEDDKDLTKGKIPDAYQITWLRYDGEQSPTITGVTFLEEQLYRLKEVDKKKFQDINKLLEEGIPKNELDIIIQYKDAVKFAIEQALSAAMSDNGDDVCLDGVAGKGSSSSGESTAQTCATPDETTNRYDNLTLINDTLDFFASTCSFAEEGLLFPGYKDVEKIKSQYQRMEIYTDPDDSDTCFNLDNIVQICGNYRPQYHEMMVHYPARYLPEVKRVAFIGGGDSMVLHEVMKFPSLELVIGLELDQMVPRKSFKHFGTQPHWDKHNKLQWWIGDASKSLLMLPKEYFGSFDLVLVDLSETVMSMTVTKGLDIMEALGLLLKPEGIFVKNEFYHDKLSQIFEYTTQIHYDDIPVRCSQAMVMGSNAVDFLKRKPIDHNVETLYLPPLDQISNRYFVWHDYRRNVTSSQQHCKHLEEEEEASTEQERNPGIIMILEAENAIKNIDDTVKLAGAISTVLKDQGLNVLSKLTEFEHNDDGNVPVVIVCREGYVIARAYPKNKYCGFDIHLWSSFSKHESIKKALLDAVGNGNDGVSSAYRIVAGGMSGSKEWKLDEQTRGPALTHECDRQAPKDQGPIEDWKAIGTVLEESMSLIQETDVNVGVICGKKSDGTCNSLNAISKNLDKNPRLRTAVPIYTCPSIGAGQNTQNGRQNMVSCEIEVIDYLQKATASGDKPFHSLVVDPNVPIEMVQILHKIFTGIGNRKRMLTKDVTIISPMLDKTETWRRNFLDRFRQDIIAYDPVFRAEVIFNSSDTNSMELGVTSSGDTAFIQHLVDATTSIGEKSGLDSDVRNIEGGLFPFQPNLDPDQFYLPGHYDQTLPREQWKSQQPVWQQSVHQLQVNETKKLQGNDSDIDVALSTSIIKDALSQSMLVLENEQENNVKVYEYAGDDIGDGCVLVAFWSKGSIVVLWDGRTHIDINHHTIIEKSEIHNDFIKKFQSIIPSLVTMHKDEQPRGYGRVVNFKSDFGNSSRVDPPWATAPVLDKITYAL